MEFLSFPSPICVLTLRKLLHQLWHSQVPATPGKAQSAQPGKMQNIVVAVECNFVVILGPSTKKYTWVMSNILHLPAWMNIKEEAKGKEHDTPEHLSLKETLLSSRKYLSQSCNLFLLYFFCLLFCSSAWFLSSDKICNARQVNHWRRSHV